MQFQIRQQLPVLKLKKFVEELSQHLFALIDYLSRSDIREHPIWGRLLPYEVPQYGEGSSLGHCVRPDIILTPDGPKVCELDFVPSGRGWTLVSLPTEESRARQLQAFAKWYRYMNPSRVYYATATITTCREEAEYFCDQLSARGVPISAINIDEDPPHEGLIDRLFYRSECTRYEQNGVQVITKEPFLDSKMIFALVHDPAMEKELVNALGLSAMMFLREAFIDTYARTQLDERPLTLEGIARHQERWVLKNADVETDTCWGSRGVMIGRRYGVGKFRAALMGGDKAGKDLGSRTILQSFVESIDFRQVWNGIVDGNIFSPSPDTFGHRAEVAVPVHAERHVYARIGVHLLLNRNSGKAVIPPYGVMLLRQNELAHGAGDSLTTAFELEQ